MKFNIRGLFLVTVIRELMLVGVACWHSFLVASIHAEEAPKPPVYGVVGELTEDDRMQIESIAPDKWGKRGGDRLLGVTVSKPGVAVAKVGRTQGLIIVALRLYDLEKHKGKWRLVRIQYVIV